MKGRLFAAAAVLALAFLLPLPSAAADEGVPAQAALQLQDEGADACLDYTPAEGAEAQPALLLGPADAQPVTPESRCKACKDQPWCKCTYNGMPRVSCDPCCYVNNIGVQICTS